MTKSLLSDVDLCALSRAGDHDAEEILLARYRPIVARASATSRIEGYDRDSIFALCNTALLKAIRRYECRGCGFGSFARRVVINAIADEIRWASTRVSLVQYDRPAPLKPPTEESLGFDDLALDDTAEEAFSSVSTSDFVTRLRRDLSDVENRILSNLLARGGIETGNPMDDATWGEISEREGVGRTVLWHTVKGVRAKARELMAA